jgi:GH15 family glucan-1,4-alpha-glucosidase
MAQATDLEERTPTASPRSEPALPSAAAPSPFPPIADYAFLSNCHTGALVAPDGSIDWLCVPRFDGPSVFASLLDRQAGSFRVGPFGISSPAARHYEPGTNVLATTWRTPTGWILVRDALTIGQREGEDTITPHTRPPADDDADHMLIRTVLCLDGTAEVEVVCEPSFDYGRNEAGWSLSDGDRSAAVATGAGQAVRLQSDLALGIEGNRIRARHVLHQGEQRYCALSWAEDLRGPANIDEANARLAATTRFWRAWLGRARIPDHPWAEQIERSALAIKGLSYMPTGATVAALTTSLPETPGGERRGQRLPQRLWPLVCSQAECATRVWRNPDQGIWEARGEPKHYVSSKLMCWVAMDRAASLAEIRGDPALASTWRSTAEEICDEILTRGVDERGVLCQHYDTDALDASSLLAALFGLLPGHDQRLKRTVTAVADELTQDGFVLRYRTDETDDGLSGEEGTFLICSFWLVSALMIVGEQQRARDLMERLLRVASPLGLYAEELDPATGRHLGNFPQAFSHLALLDAAARIILQERLLEI